MYAFLDTPVPDQQASRMYAASGIPPRIPGTSTSDSSAPPSEHAGPATIPPVAGPSVLPAAETHVRRTVFCLTDRDRGVTRGRRAPSGRT